MPINPVRYSSDFARSLLLLVLCSISSSAQSPKELWSVDLSADSDFHKRLSVEEVLLTPPTINFLNQSQIICAFYDGEEIGFDPSVKRSIFHVLEIDAHSGAFGRKLDFQAINDRSKAIPVADGGFVVLAAQELKKFSSSFVLGPSHPTPIGGTYQKPDYWLADATPDGKEVALFNRSREKMVSSWLSSDDLSLLSSLPTGINWNLNASNKSVTDFRNERLEILSKDGSVLMSCRLCVPYFLTDDLLFVNTERTYLIETIAGEKRGSGRLDGGLGDITRSAQSPRLAYLSGHYRGSGFPIKTNFSSLTGQITVLDWNTNKRVAKIDVNEPAGNPSAGLTQSALALSPDGKFLLVLLHHTLSLYRLP